MSLNPVDWVSSGYKVARKVEDLFESQIKTQKVLDAIADRLNKLEQRMMQLEANERQVIVMAQSAATGAAALIASNIISGVVTRVTQIEGQLNQVERARKPRISGPKAG